MRLRPKLAAEPIRIAAATLIVLVGAPGSGKTTFAHRQFRGSEVLSGDQFREMLVDDPSDMSATTEAFRLLDQVLEGRLRRRRLTVIDAINGRRERRLELIQMARKNKCKTMVIAFALPTDVCVERDRQRPAGNVGAAAIGRIASKLQPELADLTTEGFDAVHILSSVTQVDETTVTREA